MSCVTAVLALSVVFCSCCLVGGQAKKSSILCQIKCPFSITPCERYMTDSQGCPICQCRCYRFRLICPKSCSYGTENATDSNGCRYCRCA